MKIRLDGSTNAFMIADPLAVLEENEVHVAFSTAFKDHKTGLDKTMLHDIDVLVARSPAHLPSDIRKVRAVFKPDLCLYTDVVVFPSKGSVALASLLSGGDYDGDKAWICWDPDIVGPFENADVPDHPKIEFYGIEKDNTKIGDLSPHPDYTSRFLRHAFEFNLQMNMLGICSQYHEAYCYKFRAINNAQAMSIGMLLGNLVDSAKGGFKFDEAKWAAFKRKNKLPMILPKPAYKDKNNQKPTIHLIDHLVFVTAKHTRENVLRKFSEQFKDVVRPDDDLSRVRNEALEEAKNNKDLAEVLANLEKGIRTINTYWKEHVQIDPDDNDTRPTTRPDAPSFRTVVERCREDFIQLSPELSAPPTSDRIASWQSDHSAGRSSHWDHVKASVAFHRYSPKAFIWHVAGIELGEIKAMTRGRGTYRVVVGEIFESFKLDPKIVDVAMRGMLEVGSGGNSEVEDDFEEFGDFGVM
jgi:hypothetical protein